MQGGSELALDALERLVGIRLEAKHDHRLDPAPPLETLMMHFCGEIRLNHWYRCAAEWHTEPVIRKTYDLISCDEARHGRAARAAVGFSDYATRRA